MRRIGRRRPQLPAEAAQALEIADASKVLAWSLLEGGGAAAATVDDLRVLTPRGKVVARPWVDVDHAAWDQDSSTLAVFWVGSRQATPLEVVDASRLPEVIRERVQSSVVLAATVTLPGTSRTGRVALRKSPDGTLVTQELLPPGARADDPAVAAAMQRAAKQLQAEAGEAAETRPDAPPSIF